MVSQDRVTRAMTSDGAFRVIAAITTETATQAAQTQGLAGAGALRLAELITGAVLLRETTQPGRRVQILMRDQRGGVLVADAMPDGSNRGIVNPGAPAGTVPKVPSAVSDTTMQVSYTMQSGALHQGLVGVPAGGDLSNALMRYMQQSEQTLTVISVTALAAGTSGVAAAGGYVVQLLPEAERPALQAMTEHLDRLDRLQELLAGPITSSRELVSCLLSGFDHAELADSPLCFGCTCSEERVLGGLARLTPDERASLLDTDRALEVRCDACGRRYEIDPDQLRAYVVARTAN
ncbi:MAG TPA: Hsp33 family molecular chaperone HslO [Kofleriaceae bacterium]|nr:Hsp33 family molecular chaperone HslO [Kofleriaceae bacterium]